MRAESKRIRLSFVVLCSFLFGDRFDHEQGSHCQHDAQGQADPDVLYESRDHEHYKGDCRNGDGVRHLGGYVVEVVALTACRGHDGRVGYRRAVVTANSACKARGHTDYLHLFQDGTFPYNAPDIGLHINR